MFLLHFALYQYKNLICIFDVCVIGLVNKFLSASYWIPLSRLTYSAYLVHPLVLSVFFGSFHHTVEYTDNLFVSSFTSVNSKIWRRIVVDIYYQTKR